MAENKKQRKNYSLRLQPYEGSLLAEVVDYLNSLDRDDASRQVAEILTIALLPLARYHQGLDSKALRFSTLESCNALSQHAHFLRQVIGVSTDLPVDAVGASPPLPPAKTPKVKQSPEPLEETDLHPKSEFGSVDVLDNLF